MLHRETAEEVYEVYEIFRGTIHVNDLADLVSPSGASGRWAVGARTDGVVKIKLQIWICCGSSQNTERSYIFMSTITAYVNPMSS